MITDEMVEKATTGIKQRLAWPSMHWGVEELHLDALPHIARAALGAAASLVAAQALTAAADQIFAGSCSDSDWWYVNQLEIMADHLRKESE